RSRAPAGSPASAVQRATLSRAERRWMLGGESSPWVSLEVDSQYVSPERAEQDVSVLGRGGRDQRQLPASCGARSYGLSDAVPAQVGAGAVELQGLAVYCQRAGGVRLDGLFGQPVDGVKGAGGVDQIKALADMCRDGPAAWQGGGREGGD